MMFAAQAGLRDKTGCAVIQNLVGLGRFELPTYGLGNRCSIHLSYRPSARQ